MDLSFGCNEGQCNQMYGEEMGVRGAGGSPRDVLRAE